MPARIAQPGHGRSIEASVVIARPVPDVFAFYRDLRHFPRFLGDVLRVDRRDLSTYLWTIAGPAGTWAHWRVRITDERRNLLIRYETVTSRRWKTCWEVHFAQGSTPAGTRVREVIEMPVGWLGRIALSMIGKFPGAELRSNLRRLKQLMESGKGRSPASRR